MSQKASAPSIISGEQDKDNSMHAAVYQTKPNGIMRQHPNLNLKVVT